MSFLALDLEPWAEDPGPLPVSRVLKPSARSEATAGAAAAEQRAAPRVQPAFGPGERGPRPLEPKKAKKKKRKKRRRSRASANPEPAQPLSGMDAIMEAARRRAFPSGKAVPAPTPTPSRLPRRATTTTPPSRPATKALGKARGRSRGRSRSRTDEKKKKEPEPEPPLRAEKNPSLAPFSERKVPVARRQHRPKKGKVMNSMPRLQQPPRKQPAPSPMRRERRDPLRYVPPPPKRAPAGERAGLHGPALSLSLTPALSPARAPAPLSPRPESAESFGSHSDSDGVATPRARPERTWRGSRLQPLLPSPAAAAAARERQRQRQRQRRRRRSRRAEELVARAPVDVVHEAHVGERLQQVQRARGAAATFDRYAQLAPQGEALCETAKAALAHAQQVVDEMMERRRELRKAAEDSVAAAAAWSPPRRARRAPRRRRARARAQQYEVTLSSSSSSCSSASEGEGFSVANYRRVQEAERQKEVEFLEQFQG